MHRLAVLYGLPSDPAHFRAYHQATHLPLVRQLPGVRAMRYSYDVTAIDGSAPYFAIFEAEFASIDTMIAALESPEGQAAAGDLQNFATGGATLIHYPLTMDNSTAH